LFIFCTLKNSYLQNTDNRVVIRAGGCAPK
jgi:hypothetical protein